MQSRSPILFAASVRRCVSLPALSLSAASSDNDGDVLMRPRATAAAVVLHPARPPHAVLIDTTAAAVADAAAGDVQTARRVAASATLRLPDATMKTADADADANAELLLDHSDCKGDADVRQVSSSAQSAADNDSDDDDDDDDMGVMTDVDAGCGNVTEEAEASRQQRQCVDSAEVESSSVRNAAVGAHAAVTVMRRSRRRVGGGGIVAT